MLYVTDYTQNTTLYSYSLDKHPNWKGPFGQYTLSLACWENVADLAQMCKVGGYYLFKNVRAKKYLPRCQELYLTITEIQAVIWKDP